MTNLRKWKKNLKNMMSDPWGYSGDSDHPDCPQCESTMNFYGHDENGDFPLGEGYWECTSCGFKISENQLKN